LECKTCHEEHHAGIDIISAVAIKNFKPETFMTVVNWKLTELLNCEHTFGYITKHNRIKQGLAKSHVNDAFIIARGHSQGRCKYYEVNQTRRNNRSIQLNRKGYKPSIRRKRYKLQSNDLIRDSQNNTVLRAKGVCSYGRSIKLEDGRYTNVKNIKLICYGKGICYI